MNDDFDVEEAEGSHLTDDLVVGKQIAGGAQVCGMWLNGLSPGCMLYHVCDILPPPRHGPRAPSICCPAQTARIAGSC